MNKVVEILLYYVPPIKACIYPSNCGVSV